MANSVFFYFRLILGFIGIAIIVSGMGLYGHHLLTGMQWYEYNYHDFWDAYATSIFIFIANAVVFSIIAYKMLPKILRAIRKDR